MDEVGVMTKEQQEIKQQIRVEMAQEKLVTAIGGAVALLVWRLVKGFRRG